MQEKKPKEKKEVYTQGHVKMLRYLQDIVRNENFKDVLKKLRKTDKKRQQPEGTYYDWTLKQQKEHDAINAELNSIIQGYELLRKRCKKILRDKNFIHRETIASDYGLDYELSTIAISMLDKEDVERAELVYGSEPVDLCRMLHVYEDELSPFNKGEEIIYLNPSRQLTRIVYPVAVGIHSKASKRDVLDYIEKRWKWIESSFRFAEQKPMKIRKRKNSQEMLDFIWSVRFFPAKEIKEKLDEKFPKNGLVYYEISKIIHLETQKRFS